ncbi:zinc-dependent metalloprotease [Arcicella lustrica]|uniref:Zinc-dependent metalloprotease n=1 Tax=Arcicella lustrica TaxID=2984196 RepID=A0ABU5SMA7_9BACT|nr:zinc-dependent metalloprotease [Arcicella sp. DC25W]MEA5428400.1 zinc-dependent metalloprotease [Arcicella sp. DC25W]
MLKTQTKIALLALSCFTVSVNAQDKKGDTKAPAAATTAPAPKPAEAPKPGPKPYKEVITDKAKTSKGLFTVHKIDDKYFFEIPDSIMGKEIMSITRFTKVATIPGTYGGEMLNRQVIRFEKAPENKVFLRAVQYINVSPDSAAPIYKAVKNSNVEPIAQAFDLKAIKKDSISKTSSSVIEVTEFFKGDNQIFSLPPYTKTTYKLTAIAPDRSYIQSIKSYPINTEIRTVKTFNAIPPMPSFGAPTVPSVNIPGAAAAGAVTIELNTSMILLPSTPMKKRYFDNRVGYFASGYTVFEEGGQRTEDQTFAVRWRLEPKNAEDAAKQKRGELIEPKKPIVYYIDPATPEKWRKYLKMGVDDWQKAFEAAGWKNAIRGEILSEKDTTISLEDARYSAIRYFASDIENAYGPNVNDPRSGEILESHIGWYHNVMKLLKKWYMTQGAAVDPRARKNKFDDELMGDLIRFVSSHEVGHTIGLRHNYGSSSTVPVEKLRDPKWIAEHGHTPSIMDYARFNYVAQPEDGVKDLYPRIGEYDIWAIKWAYQTLDGATPEDDQKTLSKQYIQEFAKNPRIWFGTETNPYDPRTQSECLGDDNMLASDYGIKNLKRIVPNLTEWTKEEAQDFDMLTESYNEIVTQYRRYIGHVSKNIGGVYETPKTADQQGAVYEPTPKSVQKNAVLWLNRQVFDTPSWLLDDKIITKIRPDYGVDAISRIQEATLNNLFTSDRLQRLVEMNAKNPASYSLDELFTDVRSSIWSEARTRKVTDATRRNLQKVYVERMLAILNGTAVGGQGGFSFRGTVVPAPVDPRKTDITSVTRGHLLALKSELKAALPLTTDKMTKYHFEDVLFRIEKGLDPK